jgi:hypothetical protein
MQIWGLGIENLSLHVFSTQRHVEPIVISNEQIIGKNLDTLQKLPKEIYDSLSPWMIILNTT